MDMKERMAQAAERNRKRREYLEEQARQRGIEDVDAYVRATVEAEDGPFIDDEPQVRGKQIPKNF